MKRTILLIYQVCIWLPLMLAATGLTAVVTMLGCFCGGERIFSYYPGKFWSKFTCWISFCPVRVVGREKLTRGQSYIFTANHQGAFDIFLLYGYLHFPIKWVMKQSLRDIPLVGKACEMAGFIFVDNSSPAAAARTIKDAENRLKNGDSIAIFPEGSRSKTGQLGKFKKGAFQMAIDMHLPIVPVTINGSFHVMPRHSFCLTPHRMELIIHDPINTDFLAITDPREAVTVLRNLSDQAKDAIAERLT
jgi:1-acyl-sn-glycerol-3-phosphate acyltransferase